MEHPFFALCFVSKLTITQKSGLFHFFFSVLLIGHWGKGENSPLSSMPSLGAGITIPAGVWG
jgi:hypothetical protein